MDGISAAEIQRIRTDQASLFRDACQIGVRSAPSGGDPSSVTWAWGPSIRCGVSAAPAGAESVNGSDQPVNEVTVRVPAGTMVTSADRIRVTVLDFVGLTGPGTVYAVTGMPVRGLSCTLCRCVPVPGGSVI